MTALKKAYTPCSVGLPLKQGREFAAEAMSVTVCRAAVGAKPWMQHRVKIGDFHGDESWRSRLKA